MQELQDMVWHNHVSLYYVLLFLTGQLGWHPHIEFKAGEEVHDAGELEPNEGENNRGQVLLGYT